MLQLADVTGQRAAINAVLARKAILRKECVLIHNSGGMGASWAMCEAGAEWERQGGCPLKATGAAIIPPRPLLPWLLIRSPARDALARREVLVGTAVEATKAVPLLGDAASYLVAEVLKHRRKGVDRGTQFLTEKEQDLLFVIQTTAGNEVESCLVKRVHRASKAGAAQRCTRCASSENKAGECPTLALIELF
jgi:hypothetical protein